ncbi:hypothetical protein [Thioalkalivibrio sp. ALMg9]|uniref:hypothetical protein n=1 Tax=Thioalkalivibrio sp. ALMg9 TaxID=1266912 RepID=UPI00036692D3|nr:hypothetical protein [Thioalkalivibrio sp. ALMg9]
MMEFVIDWRGIGVLASLFVTWSGVLFWIIKWLLDRYQHHLDGRLNDLDASHKEKSQEVARVERDLLNLKAEIPVQYVRRDDYVRGQSVIEAKLDALAGKLEQTRVEANRDH